MVSSASSRSWGSIAKPAAGPISREPAARRRSESSRSTTRVATTAGSGSDWRPSDGALAERHAPSAVGLAAQVHGAVVAPLHQNRIAGRTVWLRLEFPTTEHGKTQIARCLLTRFGRGTEGRGRRWRILRATEQRRRQRKDTQYPDPSDVHVLCPLCTSQRRRPCPADEHFGPDPMPRQRRYIRTESRDSALSIRPCQRLRAPQLSRPHRVCLRLTEDFACLDESRGPITDA